jgi:glycosyltransferase involved in cell wall biosynthesis
MTLGGSQFCRNAITYDYCFLESIENLLAFCDKVSVVDAGSTDGTDIILHDLEAKHKNLSVLYLEPEAWEKTKGMGREKLCVFTDMAIERLDTDYNYYQQSDEITHEKSFDAIRKAMEVNAESYMISRINLWATPYLKLNVPQNRLPCSTQIIRLAKTKYRSIGDAESLNAQCIMDYVDEIRMYHMGFVRKREVMKEKIINMQCGVFEMEHYDDKLDKSEYFNPYAYFEEKDLAPISEPLPNIIQHWAFERYINNNIKSLIPL